MFTRENPHFVRVVSPENIWQVGRHVVGVLSRVVRTKCGNFCENDALFRDFEEKKKKKKKNSPSFLATFQSGLWPETKILFFFA